MKSPRDTVVVSAVRTPFGKYGGSLSGIKSTDLGAMVIKEVVERSGIEGKDVDYVYMGQVLQAGVGQIPSRQATLKSGLPVEVPSETVNKVCASSLRAVNLADMMIRLGEGSVVIAGGMESMSQAPYLLPSARFGARMGHTEMIDAMIHDGLWCSFGNVHMGVYGHEVASEYGISREAQDEWAYRSHQLAIKAHEEGRFNDELMPVEIPQRKGNPLVVDRDESPRADTSLEKLASLKPAFQKDGSVTAGNAPGLNDGASAILLMSREKAEEYGLEILATVVSSGQVSQEPKYLHTVPYLSAMKAVEKANISLADVDLFEINEAFAAVTLTSMKLGNIPAAKVNVNGGAVALGHPIGASGGRLLMTLIYELKRRGGGYGMAAICSGGGQGEATLVRVD